MSKDIHDQRLFLLEATVPGKEPGEVNEYAYRRKGDKSLGTVIHIVYYDKDGMPVGGTNIADYDYEAGEWKEVK